MNTRRPKVVYKRIPLPIIEVVVLVVQLLPGRTPLVQG
jgi:hypothetical protein